MILTMNYSSLLLLFILISFHLQCCDTKKGGRVNRRRTDSKKTKVKKNKAKDEAVKDIRKRMDFFVKSWNSNDMDSVASISSENAVLMGHSMDTVNGREAIRISVLAAKTVFDKINIRILEIVPVNKKYAFHLEEWKGMDIDGHIVVEKGSASEILLSAKELSCRKTNQQSQRYLTGFLRQMDLEKKMVGRDWDHRMKTFVAQRRKFMPAVWEYKDRQRPRTVATPGERAGYHVIEKSSAPILPRHNSPNIPMEWTLCASYRVLKTGERIRRPLPNTAHTVSARPVPTRRHRVVPRKAMSAPAQRSNPTSFLITQQDNADELDKLIRANDVSANDVKTKYDVSNNAFANNSNNDVDRNKVQALRPKPPSSGRNNTRTVTSSNVRRRVRPVSTTRANKLHTNEPAVSGLKRCNSVDTLSSCSSSSLKDSMGSFTLLKKLTGAEHFT